MPSKKASTTPLRDPGWKVALNRRGNVQYQLDGEKWSIEYVAPNYLIDYNNGMVEQSTTDLQDAFDFVEVSRELFRED